MRNAHVQALRELLSRNSGAVWIESTLYTSLRCYPTLKSTAMTRAMDFLLALANFLAQFTTDPLVRRLDPNITKGNRQLFKDLVLAQLVHWCVRSFWACCARISRRALYNNLCKGTNA